ncbi:diguanylate cyclase (GGDEF)-like protein [Modicisalibacter xianhensis]|uniref:diguanylate cyclase n=1 Tax=Modicisalibacter xianhensis TaxID=442341 RepID=A0A4R8FR33_9GAMM|nr:GGDEF domain-containing protein [Halomonas xianhensis]TDX24801.1 diguanylate cyclase (GGDEF)-like protein [Halomonas xianhensis]
MQQVILLDNERRRQRTFWVLLLITLPAALLFTGINVALGAMLLALLNLGLVLASMGLLMTRAYNSTHPGPALIYLSVFFGTVTTTLTWPELHPSAYVWAATFPVLSYVLLQPISLALCTAIIALLSASVGYWLGAESEPSRLAPVQLAHILLPPMGLLIFCHCYAYSRYQSDQRLLEYSLREPLTGLWNRKKLDSEFVREAGRAYRTGMPLSLILIDLDNFKCLNDRYGHEAGDKALVFIAQLMKRRLRQADLACRIGGEEFAILLPDTAAHHAVMVAEDLRTALEKGLFFYRGKRIHMTLSAGVAELGRDGETWTDIYRAADERLYACKNEGRNCVLSSLG